MSVPLLSLVSSTVRPNPLQSTSSHCKINRSSWPNKTQISEKKYEGISNHAYKRSKKLKYFHGYKKIDVIINSKFIDTNKHTAKDYIIWISKRPLYWESRERGIHIATNYGSEGLQRTTHASSERHQWKWWTPLWWCLDWIWWFWTLRGLDEYFVDSPRVLGFWGYL